MASRFEDAIESTVRALRQSRPFRTWLRSLRWCGDSIGLTTDVAVRERVLLAQSGSEAIVTFLLRTRNPRGGTRLLHLPLSVASARLDPAAFELETEGAPFYISEAERRESYARVLVDGFRRSAKIPTATGDSLTFRGEALGGFRGLSAIPAADTSNVLVRIATGRHAIIVKSYRFLDPSNREPEIMARLHGRKFLHVAQLIGEASLGRGRDRLVLGVATEEVDGPDLFSWWREGWTQALGTEPAGNSGLDPASLSVASDLGEALAKLHEALFDRHPGPWRIETFTMKDFHAVFKEAMRSLGSSVRRLGRLAHGTEEIRADAARRARTLLIELRKEIEGTLGKLETNVGGTKSVIHSDLHLAQVLRRRSDDRLIFIDFEGEPERALGLRSRKLPPIRDVATMVRSFGYVRHYVMRDTAGTDGDQIMWPLGLDRFPTDQRSLMEPLTAWEARTVDRFVRAYLDSSTAYHDLEPTEVQGLVNGWAMEKALYELDYELTHRPENFLIPLEGIAALAASDKA